MVQRQFVFHEDADVLPPLYAAVAGDSAVYLHLVRNPLAWWRLRRGQDDIGFSWRADLGQAHARVLPIPGLRRAQRLSDAVLARSFASLSARVGEPDVVVIDSPFLSALFDQPSDALRMYYAMDPYLYYAWDSVETRAREDEAMQRADLVLAVSMLLADDLRARTATPVHYLPNAVAQSFVQGAATAPGEPEALSARPPRIGCLGVLSASYDWPLIDAVAERCPDVSFVFIGPSRPENEAAQHTIEATLARPNVTSLGPRQRAELPALLNACDALWVPLRVNAHNDRRCPLRLFEYLATDRPVIATAIHEATRLAPIVRIVTTPDDAAAALRAAVDGTPPVDLETRRRWRLENTWEFRANRLGGILHAARP